MRCTCCDRLLNDFESTRKSKTTGEYLDTCNKCYSFIQQDVSTVVRNDLLETDVPDDEIEFEELDFDEDGRYEN
jgi:hypothetical protein